MLRIIRLVVFYRIGIIVLSFFGSSVFVKNPNSGLGAESIYTNFNFFKSLAQWDGGYYFNIASSGYTQLSDYAFAPVYPYLTHLISKLIFNNILLSGLFISNLSFILFIAVLYKYVDKKKSKAVAASSVISFMVFPTTFYTAMLYSESLFLLLCILFFYLLDNKRFLLSSLVITVASLTRFIGIFLLVPLIFTVIGIKNHYKSLFSSKWIYIAFSSVGLFVYSIYLNIISGNALSFLHVQDKWNRELQDPLSTFFSYYWGFITKQNRPINDYMDFFITISFIIVLVVGIHKIPKTLWIFSILVILIPASTSTLTSVPRYALASIGVFIIFGQYLEEKPFLKIPFWSAALILQTIFSVLFINGHWIA